MTPVIVMVDFDGVIHPIRGSHRSVMDPLGDWRKADWKHVKSLAAVLADFEFSRVVISSHWRLYYPIEELRAMLHPIRVFDTTGPDGYTRYREIADFIAGFTSPSQWLALDDNDDMWPEEDRWRLVLCKPWLGLEDPSRLEELRRKLEIYRDAADIEDVRGRMSEAFPRKGAA